MRLPGFFISFGILLTSCSHDRTFVVGLQPFENFDLRMTDTIATTIKETYGFKTVVLNNISIPSEAFINVKTPRYRADVLIQFLSKHKPDSLDYIVGLTDRDISFTKRDEYGNVKSPEDKYKDWGIFGLGYRPGSSCIISTHRAAHRNSVIYLDRMKKISIHELGHNLGLEHCATPYCVMQDAAETIKTIDKIKPQLCSSCKRKVM